MEIDALRSGQWLPATAQPSTPGERTVPQEDVVQAVKAVNQSALFGQQYELTFDMDRESHRALLRLVDRNTREVVRQIPPEYVLRLARELKRDRVGR